MAWRRAAVSCCEVPCAARRGSTAEEAALEGRRRRQEDHLEGMVGGTAAASPLPALPFFAWSAPGLGLRLF
jgi:hypothetical protein